VALLVISVGAVAGVFVWRRRRPSNEDVGDAKPQDGGESGVIHSAPTVPNDDGSASGSSAEVVDVRQTEVSAAAVREV
jgi:hypothetical protein